MRITADFLTQLTERNLHICLDEGNTETLRQIAETVAKKYNVLCVVLDDEKIKTPSDLIIQVAKAFQFPKYSGESYERLNWDGANDWLGDLEWLTNPQEGQGYSGFILIYDTSPLVFNADPVEFATFLDIVVTESQYHIQNGTPFHVIIGQTNHRMLSLLNMLRIAKHLHYTDEYRINALG